MARAPALHRARRPPGRRSRHLRAVPADRPRSTTFPLGGLALAALETVPPGARPSQTADRLGDWPLPARLRRLISETSVGLDARIVQGYRPLDQMLRQQVRAPITTSTRSTLRMALRTVHERAEPGTFWYEAQCVSWSAHYDAVRRTSGVIFTPEQNRLLDLWATPTRSCGWWWPREDVCVVSERPVEVHAEVWGDEGRCGCTARTAPRSGTPTAGTCTPGTARGCRPGWWTTRPSTGSRGAERRGPPLRDREHRLGRLHRPGLPASRGHRAGPGNPGSELHLYDLREQTRVLLAVNGSTERDGHRRRYGLTVPDAFTDPVAAAGWTYGLSADQYSRLVRRT